jgi:hypothetical protein
VPKRPLIPIALFCFLLVFNLGGCSGGGGGSAATTTQSGSSTTATALSPASMNAGSTDFTLAVSGTNFSTAAKVYWNGNARTTTFTSSTSLQAAITKSDVASAGTAAVYVVDGSTTTPPLSFTISAPAPPTATSLNPATVQADSASFVLTVNGTGFDTAARVFFGTTGRPTTVVSPTQVTTVVFTTDILTPGTINVTVQDNGTTTTALPLTVTPATLMLNSITPNSVTAGSPAVTLSLQGSAFASGSTVQFGTTSLATTYQSSQSLSAIIPANLMIAANTYPITVISPGSGAAGPQTTNAVNFVVSPLPSGTFITDVTANDIAGDPTRNMIYASVPSTATAYGNNVVTVDGTSGAVVKAT